MDNIELALVNIDAKLGALVRMLQPKPVSPLPKTRLLIKRVAIATSGTAVQLPPGKVIGGKILLSTSGNAGDIFLGDSKPTAQDGVLRFTIMEDKQVTIDVPASFELSQLWVDAANDTEWLDIFCHVQRQ